MKLPPAEHRLRWDYPIIRALKRIVLTGSIPRRDPTPQARLSQGFGSSVTRAAPDAAE